MRVLVTDGDQRPALAIARALGRRGITVLVGDERTTSLASASKFCDRHVTYPSPYSSPDAFEQFVLSFAKRERIDVVIPVSDVTTFLVARSRPALGGCATTAPPLDAFEQASNKAAIVERARACGIPVPRTHVVRGAARLGTVASRIEYPVVVKPARSRILTNAGWIGTTVQYADGEKELQRLYRETSYLATYPSLIQERIAGPGIGVFVLFDRGSHVASFAHRRVREKPPSGGVSVLCESTTLEPELLSQAIQLLGPLRWHGVAMLEYKVERQSAIPYLMEVNGRFWGSLQLAIDAGVDFPALACQLATGDRPDPQGPYRIGVRSRWLLGDVDHLLARLFHRKRTLQLPDDAPSTWRAVVDFVSAFRGGVVPDVERADDLLPAAHEWRRYAGDLASSFARGVAAAWNGQPGPYPGPQLWSDPR